MPVNLDRFDTVTASEEGVLLELRDVQTGEVITDDDGKPITLLLAGPDSERARKAEYAATNRRIKMRGRRTDRPITVEEMQEDAFEVLIACTIAWSGFAFPGETQEPECTPQNVRQVYKRYPQIRRQAEAFRQNEANFLKPSPTSS